MPTYEVVFTNGEKRNLIIDANSVEYDKDGMIRFLRTTTSKNLPTAIVPVDRVLYVVRVEEPAS